MVDPLSDLSTDKGIVFGKVSNPIQVSGNTLPGDKPFKVIELFGDEVAGNTGVSNILRDSDGNIWSASEGDEIIGAEFSFTPIGSSNVSGIALRVDTSGTGTNVTAGSNIINVNSGGGLPKDVSYTRKVSLLNSRPLGSEGSSIITLAENNRLYVTPNGSSSYLLNVRVKLYYR